MGGELVALCVERGVIVPEVVMVGLYVGVSVGVSLGEAPKLLVEVDETEPWPLGVTGGDAVSVTTAIVEVGESLAPEECV